MKYEPKSMTIQAHCFFLCGVAPAFLLHHIAQGRSDTLDQSFHSAAAESHGIEILLAFAFLLSFISQRTQCDFCQPFSPGSMVPLAPSQGRRREVPKQIMLGSLGRGFLVSTALLNAHIVHESRTPAGMTLGREPTELHCVSFGKWRVF